MPATLRIGNGKGKLLVNLAFAVGFGGGKPCVALRYARSFAIAWP